VEKDKRRAHLLQSAREVFAEKGYHRTSVSDIIERSDVARGTFYLYFSGKRDVFDCILDIRLKQLQGLIHPIDLNPGSPPPVEQLRSTLRSVMQTAIRGRDETQILLNHASGLDSEVDAKMTEFYQAVQSRIESALAQGMILGLVRKCSPGTMAHCIMGVMKEIIGITSAATTEAELDDLLTDVMDFGLRGLLATPAQDLRSSGPSQ
jgi:AcrR family transcriptional regulator